MKFETIRSELLTMMMLLALASTAMASNRWYVNGIKGSDSNPCSSRRYACQTIGHAISLAAPGDTVVVAAATYPENLTINFSLSIIGAGASTTIIDGGRVNGVVTISNAESSVLLRGVTIQHGSTGTGGGIFNNGAWLNITRCTITRNAAENDGGGIYDNGGNVTIRGSTVSYNVAEGANLQGVGGGIVNGGTMNIRDSLINNNVGYTEGGGVYNEGTLTISDTTLSGNYPALQDGGAGGGVYNITTLYVTTSTFLGNVADWGGGIANGPAFSNLGGTVTVDRSTFNGNFALHVGGGIFSGGGTLTVTNSTLTQNDVGMGTMGGGAVNGAGSFNNVTISGNTALNGAGGITGGGTIQNSIVANNSPDNCAFPLPTSLGYNLSSDESCYFGSAGDLFANPQLGPLQDNGGPTQTMALPPGSPAVDAGNPRGCTNGHGTRLRRDQRGEPRPDPGACDMGAYQLQDN